MTKVLAKIDRHGRKIKTARKAVTVSELRGVSIAAAVQTIAYGGGWKDDHQRIAEVCEIAEKLAAEDV